MPSLESRTRIADMENEAEEAGKWGMDFFGRISAFTFELFEMLDTVRTGVIFETFQVADHFNRL